MLVILKTDALTHKHRRINKYK